MIKATCINSKNKPAEVQLSEWINEGWQYTITHVFYHPKQGIQGCALREVRLTAKSTPYESYALSRFGVTPQELDKLIQMVIACSELNDIDVRKLIEESNLIVQE